MKLFDEHKNERPVCPMLNNVAARSITRTVTIFHERPRDTARVAFYATLIIRIFAINARTKFYAPRPVTRFSITACETALKSKDIAGTLLARRSINFAYLFPA